MSLQIDKNVEIPTARQYGFKHEIKSVVLKMEIGDSVFIEEDSNKVSTALTVIKSDLKEKGQFYNFTTRKEEKGCRFWRIAPSLALEVYENSKELLEKMSVGDALSIKQIDENVLLEFLDHLSNKNSITFHTASDTYPNDYIVKRIS